MLTTMYALQPTIQKFRRAVHLTIKKGFLPPTPRLGGRMSNGFVYILEGKTRYDFGEYTIDAKAGDLLFLPKGSYYSMQIETERYSVIFANFNMTLPEDVTLRAEAFPATGRKNTENLFWKILNLWQLGSATMHTECLAVLYAIYADFLHATSKGYMPSLKYTRMDKAIQYIHAHLQDATLNVPQIAQSVQMSDGHFRRQFKETNGMSPVQYINMRRIALTKEKLRYTDFSISEIAEACGFSDLYYLSHLFKKEVGCSPSEYRIHHAEDPKI